MLQVAASYVHDIIPAKAQGFDVVWINRDKKRPAGPVRPDLELLDLLSLPAAVP